MTNINIILKMGMQGGKNTKRFNVSKNMTLGQFKQLIIDREGFQDVQLVFRAKQLPKTKDDMTLTAIGCYNNAIMHCAAKLLGGTTGPGMVTDILEETEGDCNIFKDMDVLANGGRITKLACEISASNGCANNEIKKAVVPCGCIYCADCMRIRIKICTNNSYRIRCGNSGHTEDTSLELALAIGGYKQTEANELQAAITEIWMVSFMRICPNQKCQQFVYKGDNLGRINRVLCPSCKAFDYCWFCSQRWKGGGTRICGNADCDGLANVQNELEHCDRKTITVLLGTTANSTTYEIKNVPVKRLCPNVRCGAMNIHEDKCKHMSCPHCRHQYCQSCLKDWKKRLCNNSNPCTPAPTQLLTRYMITN